MSTSTSSQTTTTTQLPPSHSSSAENTIDLNFVSSVSGWPSGTVEFDRLVSLLSSYDYTGNNITTLEMAKAVVKVQMTYEQTEEAIKSLEKDYLLKSSSVAQSAGQEGVAGGGINLLRAWAMVGGRTPGKNGECDGK
eukprot:GHVS01008748.1.p1 GENE.GHVS01008748.1~~GHVS01008748.1.p1  ORF type:complete len:137 (-),score=45.24 GHVS01008748.1:215-625(-)